MQQKSSYSFGEYIGDLWYFVRPYKVKFWIGVFFRFTSDIARLYPAIAISKIIQTLSQGSITENYNSLIYVFFVWGLSTSYYSFAHNFCKYLGFQVAERAALDLYKETLSHIFRLDFSWQEKENSGNKMKRIDRGQQAVDLSVRKVFNPIVEIIVNTVGIIAIFVSQNIVITIALIVYVIVFVLLGTYLLKRAINQERVVSKSGEDLEGLTFESLNNIHTIKSLAIDGGIARRVDKKVADLFEKVKKRVFYYQTQYGILNTYANFFKYFAVLYLAVGVVNGTSDIGILVLFIGLFGKVDESAGELTDVIQELSKAKIWMSRAMEIMKVKPVIEDPNKLAMQKNYNPEWKHMRLMNITFNYKKKKALDGISFDIDRGEKVGVVGISGAGKSTLFKLLLDLYEKYSGDINFDDISLENMKRQSYIDKVSVVLQDTELFDMSLKDNIEIAASGVQKDPKLLKEVIKMAHLSDVVLELPQGINTIVGEKGIKLSGGQRQRLGIARALYRQPDILLLDEATSHLDAHSEKEIQKAILENVNKFTTIVIAHRLSTIKAMDKIIVLEKGRVAEQGTFSELINKKGVFAKMWTDQKI